MSRRLACCQENRSKSKSFAISDRYENVFLFGWIDICLVLLKGDEHFSKRLEVY